MNNQIDKTLKRKVLVSRLNGRVSCNLLREKFKRFGRIRDIKAWPGFAIIKFAKQSHAFAAETQMDDSCLDEQKVSVKALGFMRVPSPPRLSNFHDRVLSQNGKKSVSVCVQYFL